MVIFKKLEIIFLVVNFFFIFLNAEWKLQVYNNGPAILDSNITFTAYLEGDDEVSDDKEHIYIFHDNTDITPVTELKSGRNVSYTFNCDETTYKEGSYTMTVTMKERRYRKLSNHTLFTLTENVPGKIIFHQDGLPQEDSGSYVSSNKEVNLTAVIHDPTGFFDNFNIFYTWYINSEFITNTIPFIASNFTAGKQEVSVIVLVVTEGKPKSGNFRVTLDVKDPIGQLNVTGKLAIPHGDIFHIDITCNGSAPFTYCFNLFRPNETIENATCTDITMTTTCIASYQRYLPAIGSYHILVYLRNDVNVQNKIVAFQIFDISHKALLSTVITPVVCSITVIIIIAAGIVYHIHYRKTYTVEVADFDFQQEQDWILEEEDGTEKTIFQHICDTLKKTISHKFSCSKKETLYRARSEDEVSPLINSHTTS